MNDEGNEWKSKKASFNDNKKRRKQAIPKDHDERRLKYLDISNIKFNQ